MPSILVVVPQGITLIGRTEPVRIAELADWTSAVELQKALRDCTEQYIAIGQASTIDAGAMLDALAGNSIDLLAMPLAGYEWMSWMQGIPAAVIAQVPGGIAGTLAVLTADRIRELTSPRMSADKLIQTVLSARDRWVSAAAGHPFIPFALPRLTPRGRSAALSTDAVRGIDQAAQPVASAPDAVAVKAGLLLMHDRLDESHQLSQSIEGEGVHRSGDYWHAILHRREPDYGNSKYWFRQVGRHPQFVELSGVAAALLQRSAATEADKWMKRLSLPGGWDPMAFVDLCESAADDEDGALGIAARDIQWQEMLLLLRWTCADAVGLSAPPVNDYSVGGAESGSSNRSSRSTG